MRKILISVFITGYFCSMFATDSRVLTMGRRDNFFMDDISIYQNPANINIYPNMLIGSMGFYAVDPELDDTSDPELDDTSQFAGMTSYNRDPQKPFFGGILSYSLNQSADEGDQYPMISVGAILNRYDNLLKYITPKSDLFFGRESSVDSIQVDFVTKSSVIGYDYESPVGKVDFLLGYVLKNGGMIGGGAYVAFQNEQDSNEKGKETKGKETGLIKGCVGINWPVAKTMDLEVSVGGGITNLTGKYIASGLIEGVKDTIDSLITVADNDILFSGDVRLFSALSTINGDFVPHLGFDVLKFNMNKESIVSFNAGVGININIDRGFFWTGIEGFYEDNSSKKIKEGSLPSESVYDNVNLIGGRISFGIERNILWDWFVWRVGGTKELVYEEIGGSSRWRENPEADASDEDHVAFGLGLNIENRLKVDGVVAEDVFYTFTNLFTGNHHHLMTRITATYSF